MLKKLAKKIKGLFINYPSIESYNTKLIREGILEVGNDSVIDSLVIYSHAYDESEPNVVIGNDCQIEATIELQSKYAKVIIGNRVYVGPKTKIFCRELVEIHDDVMVSWGCTILDTNFHSLSSNDRKNDVLDGKKGWNFLTWNGVIDKPVKIMSKCWIGFNTIITKGVTIEEGTVIGCGSVVAKSTKKNTVVGGNPAVYIKDTE